MTLAAPAFAQSFLLDNAPQSATPPAPALLQTPAPAEIPEIPPAYFHEARTFEAYCKRDVNYNRYYNCECLAAQFFETRLDLGPEASRRTIMDSISTSCRDATEAAIHHYNQCLGNSLLLPSNIKPDAYCTCFATKFAEIYEGGGYTLTPSTLTKTQTNAHVECRKPGVAEEIYKGG